MNRTNEALQFRYFCSHKFSSMFHTLPGSHRNTFAHTSIVFFCFSHTRMPSFSMTFRPFWIMNRNKYCFCLFFLLLFSCGFPCFPSFDSSIFRRWANIYAIFKTENVRFLNWRFYSVLVWCFFYATGNIWVIYFMGRFLFAITSMDWNFGQTTVEKHKIGFKTAQSIRLTLWCYLLWERKKVKKNESKFTLFARALHWGSRIVWTNTMQNVENHRTIRNSEQYLKMAPLMWFIDLMSDHSMLDYCARTQIRTNGLSCWTAGQVDGKTECERPKTLSPRLRWTEKRQWHFLCWWSKMPSIFHWNSQYLTLFSVRSFGLILLEKCVWRAKQMCQMNKNEPKCH